MNRGNLHVRFVLDGVIIQYVDDGKEICYKCIRVSVGRNPVRGETGTKRRVLR